jgi:glycosyltransferase involved in cell wall biosynthesis
LGVDQQVIATGYVSDDELVWLYRNCYASLYPSLFEGFGLPVLEGMQMGAPTITSTTSSIPEVAGDAAILLDPKDTEAWAHSMLRLSQDPGERNARSEAGLKQSGRFEWRRSAEDLLGIYEEAMASPKRGAMR